MLVTMHDDIENASINFCRAKPWFPLDKDRDKTWFPFGHFVPFVDSFGLLLPVLFFPAPMSFFAFCCFSSLFVAFRCPLWLFLAFHCS